MNQLMDSVDVSKGAHPICPPSPPPVQSDRDDSECAARSPDEPFYVVWVAGENRSFLAKGRRHHNGVNDIRRSGDA
jgi:hypothetical protein